MIMRWPNGIPAGQVWTNSCKISILHQRISNSLKQRNQMRTTLMEQVLRPFQNEKSMAGEITCTLKWEQPERPSQKTGPTLPFATPKNRSPQSKSLTAELAKGAVLHRAAGHWSQRGRPPRVFDEDQLYNLKLTRRKCRTWHMTRDTLIA